MKLPDKIFGIETSKAYQDYLERAEKKEESKGHSERLNIRADINPEDYIRIPNTNVVIARQETNKGLKWEDTHYALADNGLFMPTPDLFMPYFIQVRDASQGKVKLYTADNKEIPRDEIEDLWKYLSSGHRNGCWTWLNAKFQKLPQSNNWGTELDCRVNFSGTEKKLTGSSGFLEDCIREDCFVDLEFNKQGFPTKKSQDQKYKQGENIYYWHPRNNAVAWFLADSGWADLNCSRSPGDSVASLGVFSCADLGDKR